MAAARGTGARSFESRTIVLARLLEIRVGEPSVSDEAVTANPTRRLASRPPAAGKTSSILDEVIASCPTPPACGPWLRTASRSGRRSAISVEVIRGWQLSTSTCHGHHSRPRARDRSRSPDHSPRTRQGATAVAKGGAGVSSLRPRDRGRGLPQLHATRTSRLEVTGLVYRGRTDARRTSAVSVEVVGVLRMTWSSSRGDRSPSKGRRSAATSPYGR